MKSRYMILASGIALLGLGSCSTIQHSATTVPISTEVYNLTVADLNVAAEKESVTVDWKWNPFSTKTLSAQKKSATFQLLGNSGADVLVEPQYEVTKRGIFRGGSVTVSGYPATYSNFRPMSESDAEKIATINGDSPIAVVSPIINTTSNTKKNNKKKANGNIAFSNSINSNPTHRQFVSAMGGAVIDVDGTVDTGFTVGLMYGNYNVGEWGFYGKIATATADCYIYDDGSFYYDKKTTALFTVGGIKSFSNHFNMFFGTGIGGYFTEYYDEDEWRNQEGCKFTIPVEIGFQANFGHFNVLAGCEYSTPLTSGSGNIIPFAGVGYTF